MFHWGIVGAAIATLIAQAFSFLFCFVCIRNIDFLRAGMSFSLRLDGKECKKLFILGVPAMFQSLTVTLGSMVLQSVFNSFGSLFVAGTTATGRLYGILQIAAASFSGAVITYVGQNLGANELTRIKKGVHSTVAVALGICAVVSAVMFVFGRDVLSLFISGTPEETVQVLYIAQRYLNFMICGMPLLYLLYIYGCALQGLGDTVTPMISGIAEAVMRITSALLLSHLIGADGVFCADLLAWVAAAAILTSTYYVRIKQLSKKRFSV